MFYKEKIINYQSINNIKLYLGDLDIYITSLETKFQIFRKFLKYKNIFYYILKKDSKNPINHLNVTEFNKDNKAKDSLQLLALFNDKENKNNKKYFVLLYKEQKKLFIYDNDLILINEIDLKLFLNDEATEIIQYDSNNILIFQSMNFIFINFSSNFKTYNITTYYSKTKTEKQTIYEVKVNESDMGKVIGKQGRVAKSIRTIMKAVSGKEHKKVVVEFLD